MIYFKIDIYSNIYTFLSLEKNNIKIYNINQILKKVSIIKADILFYKIAFFFKEK